VVGLVSVLTALLASLQTFLRYAERAEKHRVAAALYSDLRREMEEVRALPVEDRGPAKPHLDHLRDGMDRLGKESPEIGEWAWVTVSRRFGLPSGASPPRTGVGDPDARRTTAAGAATRA